MAMGSAHLGLNEQSNGRFLLGIGVSHAPTVSTLRGHVYGKPIATMRVYLDAMRSATYSAPPQHTAEARRLLGPDKLLYPEQMVVLETDPAEARRIARAALSRYLQLDNYVKNWRRLGFSDDDLAGGGSDRFLDANVAWGDEGAIRTRIQEHWDAGADHVCIQPIRLENSRETLDERILELLAPTAHAK